MEFGFLCAVVTFSDQSHLSSLDMAQLIHGNLAKAVP